MKIRNLIPVVLGLALLIPVAAHAGDREPGTIDLEWIKIPAGAQEVQDIDLGGVLVAMAADAQKEGNTELANALGMIHSVRVKAFSVDEDHADETARAVKKVLERLEKDGWTRLIYAKDDQETVTVSTKNTDDGMKGLMVVVFDPTDEAVFVNVAGDLNLGTIFKLAQMFGMEDLDAVLQGAMGEGQKDVEVEIEEAPEAPGD